VSQPWEANAPAADDDEQQYEVDVVLTDTILIWAGSKEAALEKAHAMGYRRTEGIRPVAGERNGVQEVPGE
jgi:hypothetical protein